jgi:predicted regulator of Ras-like GTPase activity (Roadblock/LC7/MglB family)
MFLDREVSVTAQRLKSVLDDLNRQPAVQHSILATEDGLPVGPFKNGNSLAAVAGFLAAAARQSGAMLSMTEIEEIVIVLAGGRLLICRRFPAGNTQLLLAVIFSEERTYRRLIDQTIRSIQQAVEKDTDGS